MVRRKTYTYKNRRQTLTDQRKRLREQNRTKVIKPIKPPPIQTGATLEPGVIKKITPKIPTVKPRRERTIKVGIQIGGETQVVALPESVRGAFEEKTERLVKSEIIHLIIYEIETQKLYVQLTAAGKWKDYTYLNVTQPQFEAFRDAPSKGRHFNSDIKKHNFLRGKHI